jgi:hypothetical protein
MFNTIQLNYRLHTIATTFRGNKYNMIEGVEWRSQLPASKVSYCDARQVVGREDHQSFARACMHRENTRPQLSGTSRLKPDPPEHGSHARSRAAEEMLTVDERDRSLLGYETGLSSYGKLQPQRAFVSSTSASDMSLCFLIFSVYLNGLATLSVPNKLPVLL